MKRLPPKEMAHWILTVLCALAFLSSGLQNVFQNERVLAALTELGYPSYVALILGPCKLLGAIVLLTPRLARAREWAYAGFTFAMAGAFLSHLLHGDPVTKLSAPLVFLGMVWASYLTRAQPGAASAASQ